MNAVRSVPIGDLVTPVSSWTPERDDPDGAFAYIDLSAVDQDTKAISGARVVACAESPSRARQLVRTDDVLVSTVRPILNAVARVPQALDGATASTGFCVVRPRAENLDGGYLFHWVRSPPFVSNMVRMATGASYPAVSDRIVLESKLPLPPLPEQRRIAAILDKADALRAKRRAALAQLDTLTQAIFLDMFGDPATNPKGWRVAPLLDLVSEFRYGTSSKSDLRGTPALRIPNVVGGNIGISDLKLVPVEPAEFERLRLIDGDVLFVRTNGNPDFVGRCAVFDRSAVAASGFAANEFVFASYLIRARLRADQVNPIFLREFMLGPEGRRRLRAGSKTSAGQFNINTEGLGAVSVPVPHRRHQRDFAERIVGVEKVKAACRVWLAELDALFASLQHRAFRGEL